MKIPPLKVVFSASDRKKILRRVDECLKTGMLSQGKYVKEFENRWSDYAGSKYAVAVSSGSSAIEISMRILGVKDKEVLIPVNSFAATAVSVILAGGKVRFVDVAYDTFSISLSNLKKRVTKNTVGVIVVHIGGIITPEIKAIKEWCNNNGLWLFEDCAHAHGSKIYSKNAGTFGIAGGYSFFATKLITSGEGGMIITNSSDFFEKAKLLRNHGKPRPWVSYYTQIGSNWRMSELNACVGLIHLERLNEFIEWREKIAKLYTESLKEISEIKIVFPYGRNSWYKYIILLPKRIRRDKIKEAMKKDGISLPGEVYELPLHRQPIFREHSKEGFPIAEDICSRHLCLPIYHGMKDDEARLVTGRLKTKIKKLDGKK